MKLIGHELVPYEPLFWRENAQQIEAGKQNLFKFDEAAIKRAQNSAPSLASKLKI